MMTPEQKRKLQRLRDDEKYYIENCLQIICSGELVNFKLNEPQEYVLEAIHKQQKAGKPVRIVVLKARREGISTLIEGLLYHKISTRKHRTAMVIAHELDSAKEIFEMARRFYTNFRKKSLRPMLRSMGVRNLIFDNPNPNDQKRGLDSKLVVETAMDLQAGRSMEINYLHASEVAHYRDALTLMTGLLQCVNDRSPDTMVVMESTGCGLGGYFYDYVMAAMNGENDYVLVFLPWFIDRRYQKETDKDFVATPEEEIIRTSYKWEGKRVRLTDSQLYWRRKKIANDLNGDEIQFKQEYPGSVDEAFIYSGRTRFNQVSLAEIESKSIEHKFKGFLHEESLGRGKRKHTLEANDRGYLSIYEHPQHRAEYVLFADVAEGKEISGRDTDYSSIDVLRCDTLEQVAHWHGRIAPENLADEVLKLAWYYNEAFVGIEKNSIGYAVVAAVKQVYNRLYVRVVHDKSGKVLTKEIGWLTTGGKRGGTKGLMINDLAQVIVDGEIKINNQGSIEECRRFTVHPDGSLGAPQGQHDDRVISLAGAYQMFLHSYTEPEKHYERADRDEDDDYEEDEDY